MIGNNFFVKKYGKIFWLQCKNFAWKFLS